MKKHITFACLILVLVACKERNNKGDQIRENIPIIDNLIQNLEDSRNDEVIVVAHRGDWRNAPENSLQAIQYCIDIGVDMVEIDVRETKDGHLVLMHDETIDRTTTGSGFIGDWTLDSLQTLFLVDGSGVATGHKIPTLEKALKLAKDKILVNLDKSYYILDKCFRVVQKTGTLDQVVIKGNKTVEEVKEDFGEYLDKMYFMPVIRLPSPNDKYVVESFINELKPVAIEFVFEQDTVHQISEFRKLRSNGTGIWVNSLWPDLCGGHDDEKAALDPSVYDWYVDNGVDIIQTDRPRILIKYLQEKGLHR